MDEQMIAELWTALANFQSKDGTWLQVGKSNFARAAHSVMAARLTELGETYRDAFDKGHAVGFREGARAALAPHPKGTDQL